MAESDVSGVRFRDSVRFNQTENKTLYRERDRCVLTRVSGGIKALGKSGVLILVPDSNITWIEYEAAPKPDEQKRG